MRQLWLFCLLAPIALAAPAKLVVENGAICEGKASAFFVVDNTQMIAGDNVIYRDFSEEECLGTCSNNRDPFGRSILCSSFVYDHVSFTCTIYKDKSKPEGKGEKNAAQGKRYFEKFCLATELPMECADAQFTRADDSVLVGYAVNVTLTETIEDCVATCVKDKACKSAMFFYEEGECITNTESAMSRPAAFTKEDTEKVIYFQNGCVNKKAPAASAKVFKNNRSHKKPKTTSTTTTTTATTTTEEAPKEDYDEYEKSDETEDVEGSGVEDSSVETKSDSSIKPDGVLSGEESEEYDDSLDMNALVGSNFDEKPMFTTSAAQSSSERKSATINLETESSTTTPPLRNTAASSQDEEEEIVDSDDTETVPENQEEEEELSVEPTSAATRKHSNENTKVLKFKKPAREFASKTLKAYKEDRKSKIADEEEEEEFEDDTEDDDEDMPMNMVPPSRKTAENEASIFGHDDGVTVDPTQLFSEWSDWTPCTKSGERRVRRRKCLDLRRCLGVLMQVENCPAVTTPPLVADDYVRSIIPEPQEEDEFVDQGASIPPLPSVPEPQPSVWSPWLGVCQQFASGQPCNSGEMIGFESRECMAKDPAQCVGPFFRYCTLSC